MPCVLAFRGVHFLGLGQGPKWLNDQKGGGGGWVQIKEEQKKPSSNDLRKKP